MVMKLKLIAPAKQSLKISSPALKLKANLQFPTSIQGGGFIDVLTAAGVLTVVQDYMNISETAIGDPAQTKVVVLDQSVNPAVYRLVSLSALIASTTQIVQDITTPGPVAILPNAGIVRLFAGIGGVVTLNMPATAAKTCPVLIVDWTLGCGANNATINANGAEKFPGNLSSWKIRADAGSVFLRPVNGGYAL